MGTIGFALLAVRRIKMEPAEFIVGGRSFGALLLWILLAGEIYTSFTFLGAAGWAYGKGAPAFYIIAYGPIAYIIGYFYLPLVWRIGKERGLMTWPDFLVDRYGSKSLGTGVAALQFFLTVPYVTLQLTGLQILLTIAGYGRFNATLAVSVAFLLMALFVFTAGLRGAAWASIIKDSLVLGAAMFAGIYLPIRFFGSPAAMFERVSQTQPHWLTIHAGSAPYGVTWFISTVLLTSIGFFMGPSNAQSIFAARSDNTVRRNMIFMPFYGLMIMFVLLAGLTALVVVPGLKGTAADQSYLLLLQRHFPAWVLGIVAGAGCLAALLPASVLLLGAASIFARNVLGNTRYVRVLVLVCAVLSLALWIVAKTSLVELLLFYFNGITQLAPGVMLGLAWRRVSGWAVGSGLVVGELVAAYSLHASTGPMGINWGLVALGCNVAVLTAVALVFPRSAKAPEGSFRPALHPTAEAGDA
ncbi:MAG: sodium:solute symporter family protein [Candidatus Eremiobacteraeota bacterium]|nr:sodium:solute symporter family protein [Candidatus Eremiobacteraeota bacterium]MBC5822400.1 sodium:solute symporter family protein [Candidatus Eremiobacteraeota bacterium]